MNEDNFQTILNYEICASWWACYISNKFLQVYVAKYFIWKTRRKVARASKFSHLL
jgi:hypothetical protein